MKKEPTYTLTKKYVSTVNQLSSKRTSSTKTGSTISSSKLTVRLGHLLAGASTVGAAVLLVSGFGLASLMEGQAQSVFYQLRGPIIPPEDIVILAIDEPSISIPQQLYQTDPKQYAGLEPMQAFPYKRAAYAQIIEKLIQAGARSVALDVVFDSPSIYGAADDQKFQQTLQRYGNKVALAAQYEQSDTHKGITTQLRQPQPMFRTGSVAIGSVNFPLEPDGKIYRFPNEFTKILIKNDALSEKIPDFQQAVLDAANAKIPRPKGSRIYFFGPAGTFEPKSLWEVLDPEFWNTNLRQGKVFQDKIVLIGATAKLTNDYHLVPISSSWLSTEKMSGVEIHANAIATLMQGKAISQAIPTTQGQGLFVLGLVGGCALLIARNKRGIKRFFSSIALGITWGGISYILFVYGQLVLPTAVPVVALAVIGLCYLGTEVAREIIRKHQLVIIFKKYQSSPVVQEIISQQQDFQDLLQQRDLALSGKILSGRYKILKVLGSGGFSETYIAEDTQRPGNPLCVVKQLLPANNKPEQLTVARRLFKSEAQTLEKLGTHSQIPQLLAYFEEEEEFYLIQEYILGHALSQEIPPGKRFPESAVIEILRDLLHTLAFVHQNSVIHRDIKPSNIIRRNSDGKLVLIDFGAVKEVSTQLLNNQEQTAFTIGIGTKGYAPSEQCFGRPQYSSDIYAVGMIGIKALTGIPPHELERDANGELKWIDKAFVSHALAKILSKMVLEDFQQRYQTASQALAALDELVTEDTLPSYIPSMNTVPFDDSDTPTAPWIGVSKETPDSAYSTSKLPTDYDETEINK